MFKNLIEVDTCARYTISHISTNLNQKASRSLCFFVPKETIAVRRIRYKKYNDGRGRWMRERSCNLWDTKNTRRDGKLQYERLRLMIRSVLLHHLCFSSSIYFLPPTSNFNSSNYLSSTSSYDAYFPKYFYPFREWIANCTDPLMTLCRYSNFLESQLCIVTHSYLLPQFSLTSFPLSEVTYSNKE